jgi:hypothetical protein
MIFQIDGASVAQNLRDNVREGAYGKRIKDAKPTGGFIDITVSGARADLYW